MRFYSGYDHNKVLEMPNNLFWVFLEEGFQLHSEQMMQSASIALLPKNKREQIRKFFRDLDKSSRDFLDRFTFDTGYHEDEGSKRKFFG